MDSKKGNGFVWLGVILIIVGFGLLYIMLDQPMQQIHELTKNNVTGTQYEKNYNKVFTLWDKFLLIFLFMILIAGLIEVLKR